VPRFHEGRRKSGGSAPAHQFCLAAKQSGKRRITGFIPRPRYPKDGNGLKGDHHLGVPRQIGHYAALDNQYSASPTAIFNTIRRNHLV